MKNTIPMLNKLAAVEQARGPIRGDLALPMVSMGDVRMSAARAMLERNLRDKAVHGTQGQRDPLNLIRLDNFSHLSRGREKRRIRIKMFTALVLLAIALMGRPATATSFISVEPIPSVKIVGDTGLNKILNIRYAELELWSNRLLKECHIVDRAIDTLKANGAISTVKPSNTKFLVAAGGFEGVTNPSYVFTIQDSGSNAVSHADVNVLSNALGYVLNQSRTVHFSIDNAKAYAFSLDYVVITFAGTLTGEEAKDFFGYLGTIDSALWSGMFAGFTQIDFKNSSTNNSMLFLRPAASKQKLITGLSIAANHSPGATYVTLDNNNRPTTAKAGIAFPGNDWIAFPCGDEYLANLGRSSSNLLAALAGLRQQHLQAVGNLLNAIDNNKVDGFLNHQFHCS